MSEQDPQNARNEAEAAAHEAAGIGGRAPEDEDPARRPVDEADEARTADRPDEP